MLDFLWDYFHEIVLEQMYSFSNVTWKTLGDLFLEGLESIDGIQGKLKKRHRNSLQDSL